MADYKQMYLTLLDATERAMAVLTEAQQKCEELYIESEGYRQNFFPEIVQFNIQETEQ